MAKPSGQPVWDETEVNSIEPTTAKKQEGWQAPGGVPEKPPYQTFNYWMNNVYKWISYIDDKDANIRYIEEYGGDLAAAVSAIGATETTLVINSSLTDLTGNVTVPNNISIIWNFGSTIAGAFNLTFNGEIQAEHNQLFESNVTILGLKTCKVEWWGLDGAALQAAIDCVSFGAIGGVIESLYDVTISTVVTWAFAVVLTGKSGMYRNQLIFSGSGQIQFTSAATTRLSRFENIRLSTTDNTIDMIDLISAYETKFINCYFVGGNESVTIEEGVDILFDKCRFSNPAVGKFSLHCDSTTFVNGLTIKDTRIDGKTYIDVGPSGRNLSFPNTIFEASENPVCNVVRVGALSINGSYFEGYDNGDNVLLIGEDVLGGSITGSFLGVHTDTLTHVICGGAKINFDGNFFGTIAGNTQIELTATSKHCVIGANADGGGAPSIPLVTDAGTLNKVFGQYEKKYWIGAQELALGTGATLDTSKPGAPRIALADALISYIHYMFRMPEDLPAAITIRADVLYGFDSADIGNDARLYITSEPQNTGEAIQAITGSRIFDIEAANTNLTTQIDTGDIIDPDDEFLIIEIRRDGTSGSDTTTETLYIYGLNIKVINTLGY